MALTWFHRKYSAQLNWQHINKSVLVFRANVLYGRIFFGFVNSSANEYRIKGCQQFQLREKIFPLYTSSTFLQWSQTNLAICWPPDLAKQETAHRHCKIIIIVFAVITRSDTVMPRYGSKRGLGFGVACSSPDEGTTHQCVTSLSKVFTSMYWGQRVDAFNDGFFWLWHEPSRNGVS
jgi:hypothetical protein